MVGQTINRLTIEGYRRITKNGRSRPHFDCICECGKRNVVQVNSLLSGATKSCGCLQKERFTEYVETIANKSPKKTISSITTYDDSEYLESDDMDDIRRHLKNKMSDSEYFKILF